MTSQAELESLQRQVGSLSFELARVIHEHGQELNKKDQLRNAIVLKRDARYKKYDQLIATMRSERANLKRSLINATAQLDAKTHTVKSLQQEVATLCCKFDTATTRIKDLEAMMANQPAPGDRRRRRARATSKQPVRRAKLKKLIRTVEGTPPACVTDRTNAVDQLDNRLHFRARVVCKRSDELTQNPPNTLPSRCARASAPHPSPRRQPIGIATI